MGKASLIDLHMQECHNWLVRWGCSNKVPQIGQLRQQTFISHASGGWKSEIRVVARRGSNEDPLPGGSLLTPRCVLTMQERGKGACEGANPIHEGSDLRSNHLPKSPPPPTVTLGVGLQHMNFRMRGTQALNP